MTTEIAERPKAKTGILISVTEESIEQMATRFASLKINGINDKEGYLAVDTARKECVKVRGVIKREHAELKEESLRIGQALDAAKRTLTAKIESVEDRLVSEMKSVEDEKERLRKVEEDKVYAFRMEQLAPYSKPQSVTPSREIIMAMKPDQFEATLSQIKNDHDQWLAVEAKAAAEEAERKRVAEEQAAENRRFAEELRLKQEAFEKQQADAKAIEDAYQNRVHQLTLYTDTWDVNHIRTCDDLDFERYLISVAEMYQNRKAKQKEEDDHAAAELAEQRRELEAQRREQEAREQAIRDEEDRLVKIEAERQEAIRLEQVQKEAAEKARVETEERLAREAKAREAQRLAEEEAAKRAAALLPVRQKLDVFANDLLNIATPELEKDVEAALYAIINRAVADVRKLAKELS